MFDKEKIALKKKDILVRELLYIVNLSRIIEMIESVRGNRETTS